MIDDYEFQKSSKRGGKSKAHKHTGHSINSYVDPYLTEFTEEIIYYCWVYNESNGQHEVDSEAVDSYDLNCSQRYTLDSKNRWEIPKLVEKKAEATQRLLKDGANIDEVYVYFPYSDKKGKRSGGTINSDELNEIVSSKLLINQPNQDSSEEEIEYEVITSRKGKKAVPKNPKELPKEKQKCQLLVMPDGSEYVGIIHVYFHKVERMVILPTKLSKLASGCTCPQCDPHPPYLRHLKKKDFNLNMTKDLL